MCFQLVRINPSGGEIMLANLYLTRSVPCFQLVRINPSGGVIYESVRGTNRFPISPH